MKRLSVKQGMQNLGSARRRLKSSCSKVRADNKILCTLEHNAHFFEIRQRQTPRAARRTNSACAFHADARHAQKLLVSTGIDIHRKFFKMMQRPVAFWVYVRVKIFLCFIQQVLGLKTIKTQKPICLIQPVFPQKRRRSGSIGQCRILHHRNISRVKHSFQPVALIKPFGQT